MSREQDYINEARPGSVYGVTEEEWKEIRRRQNRAPRQLPVTRNEVEVVLDTYFTAYFNDTLWFRRSTTALLCVIVLLLVFG